MFGPAARLDAEPLLLTDSAIRSHGIASVGAKGRAIASEVMSVVFSRDGQTLASGSKDKTAMLWGLHPNRAANTVSNITSRPIFSANGQLFAAGIGQNKVAAWDAAKEKP